MPKRFFLQKTRSPILDKVIILNSWIDNIFNEPFNFNAIWETIENYNGVISKKKAKRYLDYCNFLMGEFVLLIALETVSGKIGGWHEKLW